MERTNFDALVSSRAVRISSRAVRVFPALSLRPVRPSYGTFSLMVLQGNCARGRTGHMIIYSTDRENEVCLTGSGTISIHVERLQIHDAPRKQNELI